MFDFLPRTVVLGYSQTSLRDSIPEPVDLYENLIPFNTYRINCNPFLRVFSSPGRGIEGPGVPGTNQFTVIDHALGQRASPMGAFVVQGSDDAIDICNAKCP